MSNGSLSRFFGGPPGWVIVRLIVISLVVGLIFSGLGISPLDIVRNFQRLVEGVWNMGFAALDDLVGYFIIGAVVVIPIWLVMRLSKMGRRGE